MDSVLDKLLGGDRRSIGRSDEVVMDIIDDPSLFDEVFYGMTYADRLIRMRCSDVIEKVCRLHPAYLQPYAEPLIKVVARVSQKEVRWHVALLLSRLELEGEDLEEIVALLLTWAEDGESRIAQVNAIQALADLAGEDPRFRSQVIDALEDLVVTGSPAVRNRAKRLLSDLA